MSPQVLPSRNPFTASFGVPSDLTYVGRQPELDDFLTGLQEQPGSTHRSITIAGPRGVGKTSLLAVMMDHAKAQGWVTAAVTAGPGIEERILDKASLQAESLLDPKPKRLLTGISIAGFSLQSQAIPEGTPSWWRRVNTLLDVLESRGSGLVIAVDEVHRDEPALRPLFQQYQELVNDRRNVAMVMAGLPDAVSNVLTEYSLTFVQRAWRQNLGPIDITLICDAYITAFSGSGKQISVDLASEAAQHSQGLPYLYQLIGYFTWRAAGSSDTVTAEHLGAALPQAQATAGQNLYGLELRALTARERDFLYAMTPDSDFSTVADIAQRLATSQNNIYYYRNRLVAHGLILPSPPGGMRFTSAALRDYLRSGAMQE